MEVSNQTAQSSPVTDAVRKVNRFTSVKDLMLLREVVAQNPFSGEAKKTWDLISEKMQVYIPSVTSRCCKERAMRLLKMYKTEDLGILRRSGTEEQYTMKEQLLQKIRELEAENIEEPERQKQNKSTSRQQELELDVQNAVLDNLSTRRTSTASSESNDTETKTRKRPQCNDSIIEYLTKKHHADVTCKREESELKNRELGLKERQLALDERKVQVEEERLRFEKERWVIERESVQQTQNMLMECCQIEHQNLQQSQKMMIEMFQFCMNKQLNKS